MFLPLLKAFLIDANEGFFENDELVFPVAMEDWDEWANGVLGLLVYRVVAEVAESSDATESSRVWELK